MGKFYPVLLYSEFYEKSATEEFDIIFEYDPDVVLSYLANINSVLFLNTQDPDEQVQISIFNNLFSDIGKKKKLRVVEIFNKYAREGAALILFCPPVITSLIGTMIRKGSKANFGVHTPLRRLQEDVLDAILHENDIYFPDSSELYPLESIENIIFNQLNQQYYVRDRVKMHSVYPITAQFFCNFIHSNVNNGERYIKEFCDYFGISNFLGYITPLLNLLLYSLTMYKTSQTAAIKLSEEDANYQLIEKLSLNENNLSDASFSTHFKLIPKPFWKAQNNDIYILDYTFLGFINDMGLLYNFFDLTSLKKEKNFGWPDYKGFLGKEYFEDFLVAKLFRSLFGSKSHKLFTEAKMYYPDFTLVENGKDIFLIEVKSSSIDASCFEMKSVEKYKEYLINTYARNDSGKKKGVFQLVRSIEKFTKTSLLDGLIAKHVRKRKCTIYPIVIYTDHSLDMLGVNSYLNQFFLPAIESFKPFVKSIHPLIAINLSFFISEYITMKKDRKYFKTRLCEYLTKIRQLERKYEKTKIPSDLWNSKISFHQFNSKRRPDRQNYHAIMEDHLKKTHPVKQ